MPGKKVRTITATTQYIQVKWTGGKSWITHGPSRDMLTVVAHRAWKAVRRRKEGYIRPFLIGIAGWVWERHERLACDSV